VPVSLHRISYVINGDLADGDRLPVAADIAVVDAVIDQADSSISPARISCCFLFQYRMARGSAIPYGKRMGELYGIGRASMSARKAMTAI
jgi:hypothetical protein